MWKKNRELSRNQDFLCVQDIEIQLKCFHTQRACFGIKSRTAGKSKHRKTAVEGSYR